MTRSKKVNTNGAVIAQQISEAYQPQNQEQMQDALKDIFGPMFESMLKGEMDAHLGYEPHSHSDKETDNRRNGYGSNTVSGLNHL